MLDEGRHEMLARLPAIAHDGDPGLPLILDGQAQRPLAFDQFVVLQFPGRPECSGWASQEGLGRLPAVEVGSKIVMMKGLVLGGSKGVPGGPLRQKGAVGVMKCSSANLPCSMARRLRSSRS
jgi:hypothetical protein